MLWIYHTLLIFATEQFQNIELRYNIFDLKWKVCDGETTVYPVGFCGCSGVTPTVTSHVIYAGDAHGRNNFVSPTQYGA